MLFSNLLSITIAQEIISRHNNDVVATITSVSIQPRGTMTHIQWLEDRNERINNAIMDNVYLKTVKANLGSVEDEIRSRKNILHIILEGVLDKDLPKIAMMLCAKDRKKMIDISAFNLQKDTSIERLLQDDIRKTWFQGLGFTPNVFEEMKKLNLQTLGDLANFLKKYEEDIKPECYYQTGGYRFVRNYALANYKRLRDLLVKCGLLEA